MPDPARILREAYDNVRHEYGRPSASGAMS